MAARCVLAHLLLLERKEEVKSVILLLGAGPRRPASKKGMMTLVIALVLSGLILAWGFMTSLEATSTHHLLRHVLARRLRDQAASSAIEEACARLELARGAQANTLELAVPVTSQELASLGVSLAPVRVRSAARVARADTAHPHYVFEFSVHVRVDAGKIHRAWVVTARRAGRLDPGPKQFRLEHDDLVRFVVEANA
jgi:hypothetical protein